MMYACLGVKMTGPAFIVTSWTETSPLESVGVTSAGSFMSLLMRTVVLCVVLQDALLAVRVVVGVFSLVILLFDVGTLEGWHALSKINVPSSSSV